MVALTNFTVVIIPQYIYVLNHHVVHLNSHIVICQLHLNKRVKTLIYHINRIKNNYVLISIYKEKNIWQYPAFNHYKTLRKF